MGVYHPMAIGFRRFAERGLTQRVTSTVMGGGGGMETERDDGIRCSGVAR
jgi:hypothetical protein